ncbi:MAG: hypothetical protein EOM20_15625, partial [Spartobacteria bacterium]|nr:hypothetical protein [Spartobacteria bacterium]
MTACHAQGLDISGYNVRQFNRTQSYTIPEGTVIEPNGYVVIGRNSTQADFEAFWGVTLATNVVYLNAANAFPRIDGGEQFSLLDASSTLIDGLTPSTLEARDNSIQRLDASTAADSAANWHVVSADAANPGSGGGGSGASALVISEYSDASFFFNEFIEIFYYNGTAVPVPPVLQALPNRTVTLNDSIQFDVEATPTDGDTVTLSVSNAPASAIFSSTNEHGVFRWTNAAPIGVYTMQFYAVDKDGASMDEITITVAGAPDVSFTLAENFVNEDVGTQLVAVALSRAANATVNVALGDGTASQGVDFVLSSTTLVFTTSSATEQYIPVVITDDDSMEGLETIVLTLDSATGANIVAPDEHILSIRDNETITIMAANLVNGYPSVYQDPAWRILQALKPDIIGLQECVITNDSMRAFVDLFFGEEYDFYIEPQSSAYFPQPNAIISRWPIKDAGEWSDPITANRDFAWATIDIPGDRDLHVVSLHLYYSGTEEDRAEEARALTNYIAQAGFSSNDYLVIAGDLNTADRSEPCLAVLTNIVSDAHKPADQFGDTTTSRNREYTFDYVLPSPNLDANHYITTLQGLNFDNGLVFDTRLWTNIPPPALTNDSAVEGNAHMAVMKSFSQGRTPPSLAAIPEQRVVVGHNLQFAVYAKPTDGDTVTLAAQNLPTGATFASTNEHGAFSWPNPATAGVYQCNFSATDSDGTESRAVTIKVLVDGTIWINELHYDNAGTDVNEGIEIAGNAGMDLSFYALAIYNGADGTLSKTIELDGYLPDETAGFGAVWIPIAGLQNEDEAIALVMDGTNLVQFLSYEGIVVAIDGPAIEETSENIGSETGGETDCSLQLTGLGTVYSDFSWQVGTASRGSLNALQRMYPSSGDEQQPPAIYPLAPVSIVQSNALEFNVFATDVNGDA